MSFIFVNKLFFPPSNEPQRECVLPVVPSVGRPRAWQPPALPNHLPDAKTAARRWELRECQEVPWGGVAGIKVSWFIS